MRSSSLLLASSHFIWGEMLLKYFCSRGTLCYILNTMAFSSFILPAVHKLKLFFSSVLVRVCLRTAQVLANMPSVLSEQVPGYSRTRKCIAACQVPLLNLGLYQLSHLLGDPRFPSGLCVCMGSAATFWQESACFVNLMEMLFIFQVPKLFFCVL